MTASPGKTTCHSPTRSWIPRSSWSTSRSICIMTQGYHPCLGRGVSRYLLLPLPSTASFERSDRRCGTKCLAGSMRKKSTLPASALSGRFGTAQGSSSRGGLRGLAVMAKRLEESADCAFTIDGPRGPRYVAKPGPVMLARRTGAPVVVFHIGVEHGKTFEKTWDHFLLPTPFTKTIMIFAPPVEVPPDADAALLEAKHAEMQKELERVRDVAENWFSLSEVEREKFRAEIGN